MLVTFGICFKQYFDTSYLVFYNPSPLRMFLSLNLLSEYRIQHGAIGPLYVTSSYSTWIFCRGVSGFATDCPCNVWCRGLTTCLLHVGPPFGNRFLNTNWAVGLTYWIVYLIIFLTYATIYVLIHHIIFWLYLYFLNILYFSSTHVLTSSIDIVFALSIMVMPLSLKTPSVLQYYIYQQLHHCYTVDNYPITVYYIRDGLLVDMYVDCLQIAIDILVENIPN